MPSLALADENGEISVVLSMTEEGDTGLGRLLSLLRNHRFSELNIAFSKALYAFVTRIFRLKMPGPALTRPGF